MGVDTEHEPLTADQQTCRPQASRELKIIYTSILFLTLSVSVALFTHICRGFSQVSDHGLVITGSEDCSLGSRDLLRAGGSAVDAVISAILCLCVTNSSVVGLGGGGFMHIYDRASGTSTTVNMRELYPPPPRSPTAGVLVPVLLQGLRVAHERHGVLPWSRVVENARQMALTRRDVFSQRLARTLQLIQRIGAQVMYDERYASLQSEIYQLPAAVSLFGGGDLHTLSQYQAPLQPGMHYTLGNWTIVTPTLPFGGVALLLALATFQHVQDSLTAAGGGGGSHRLSRGSDQLLIAADTLRSVQRYFSSLSGATVDTSATLLSPELVARLVHEVLAQQPAHAWSTASAPVVTPLATHLSAIDRDEMFVTAVVGLGNNLSDVPMVTTEGGVKFGHVYNSFFNQSLNTIAARNVTGQRPLAGYTSAILMDNNICGRRFILGSPSFEVVFQVILRLISNPDDPKEAVNSARFMSFSSSHQLLLEKKLYEDTELRQKLLARRYAPILWSDATVSSDGNNIPLSSCNLALKLQDSIEGFEDSRTESSNGVQIF